MRLRRLASELLRVRLAWKIAGANALLIVVLAFGFYALPAVLTGPGMSSGVVIAGMFAAATVNVALISAALRPIHQLERTAEALWSGATDVRVRPSRLADRELNRVAHAINELLESLAVERARLRKLTQQLVEARFIERTAIAHELTESVAQTATALSLECAALRATSGSGPGTERLERMGHATTGLIEEIRKLARDVYPRHIEELGLESALRSLVREAEGTVGPVVSYSTSGMPARAGALPLRLATTLHDAAREALVNARKYARAQHIDVSLGVDAHSVRLTVADDGCGFDAAAVDPTRGVGLNLIRERIALVGGTLEILSHPGKGTQIVALIPFVPQAVSHTLTYTQVMHPW